MRMILIVIDLQIIAKIIFAQLEMSHILIAMQMNSGTNSNYEITFLTSVVYGELNTLFKDSMIS